jgi:transposase-like protein
MLELKGLEVSVGAGRSAEGAVGDRRGVAGAVRVGVPDPELVERPKRRRFSAEYKLRIVQEADACSRSGEVGELLRREGLYSSLLTEWRRARDSGALEALAPRRRGPARQSPELVELAVVRRRLERSEADLLTARRVIEIQGNVYALLEDLLAKGADDSNEPR